MQQTGEYRIEAPREAVWRALNDPDVLARCIEGCEAMTRVGDDAFAARIRAKIGPVSAVFDADIALADVNPPASYTLKGAVKGGAAGLGKGAAKVNLSEVGGATLLRYEVEGSVSGKLAQVGQRLIDAAARKMADDFFARFSEAVAPGPAQKVPVAAAAPRIPVWWIAAAIAAVALIVILLIAL